MRSWAWQCARMCRWSIQYRPRRLLITWNSLLQYVINTVNMWIDYNIHVLFRHSLDIHVYLYKEFLIWQYIWHNIHVLLYLHVSCHRALECSIFVFRNVIYAQQTSTFTHIQIQNLLWGCNCGLAPTVCRLVVLLCIDMLSPALLLCTFLIFKLMCFK